MALAIELRDSHTMHRKCLYLNLKAREREMKTFGFIAVAAVAAFPSLAVAQPQNAQAPAQQVAAKGAKEEAQKIFDAFMTAVQNGDHEGVLVLLDERNKVRMTKQVFDLVSAQVAPSLKKGYTTEHLGYLKQRGYQIHLWKIVFKDDENEALARFELKDGKIGGFNLSG